MLNKIVLQEPVHTKKKKKETKKKTGFRGMFKLIPSWMQINFAGAKTIKNHLVLMSLTGTEWQTCKFCKAFSYYIRFRQEKNRKHGCRRKSINLLGAAILISTGMIMLIVGTSVSNKQNSPPSLSMVRRRMKSFNENLGWSRRIFAKSLE